MGRFVRWCIVRLQLVPLPSIPRLDSYRLREHGIPQRPCPSDALDCLGLGPWRLGIGGSSTGTESPCHNCRATPMSLHGPVCKDARDSLKSLGLLGFWREHFPCETSTMEAPFEELVYHQ